MTNKLLLLLLWMGWIGGTQAQTYRPADRSSVVKVTVKNAGMDVDALFTGLEGEISFNPADLKTAAFSVSVDAATVNTGIDVRDANLRGGDYLDAKAFPRISFVSKQVSQVKPGAYLAKGTITIKGISKDITLPFTATPKEGGMLFSGDCRLNRNDFRIGTGSIVLSDGMQLSLRVFAQKQ